jgi:outer membrane usher protein
MDATLAKASMTVTPAYRSGSVVKFPVSRANAVTLRLVQPNGRPVPAGAEVSIGDDRFPVGLKGAVFLTGVSRKVAASASWVGGQCTFEISRPAGNDPQPDLGEISCQPGPVKETSS